MYTLMLHAHPQTIAVIIHLSSIGADELSNALRTVMFLDVRKIAEVRHVCDEVDGGLGVKTCGLRPGVQDR